MVNRKTAWAWIVCLAAGAAPAAAQSGTLGVKLRSWNAELDGHIQAEDENANGSDADVQSDLGLGDDERFKEIHVFLTVPVIGSFSLQHLRGGFDSSESLNQDITFGSVTFPENATVETEIDFRLTTLLWKGGVNTGTIASDVGFGIIAGAKYLDIDAEVSGSNGSEEANVAAPVPVVGAYARVGLGQFLTAEAQIHGIHVNGLVGGLEGTLYDLTFSLDGTFKTFFAGVGYRIFHFDAKDDQGAEVERVEVDLDLTGIFFEIGANF